MNCAAHLLAPMILAALLPGALLSAQESMSGPNVLPIRDPASAIVGRIGAEIPADIELTDERGYPLKLSQFFPGDRPVLLNLGYYRCPSMCGQVVEGMVQALSQTKLQPGRDYVLLTVSFDPRDTVANAKARKDMFLMKWNTVGVDDGWRFAVGDEATTKRLCDTVGFQFRWNHGEYDHDGGLFFLTPSGRLSRVLKARETVSGGLEFEPDTIEIALKEASEGKLTTFLEELQLSCLTFDPQTRRYSLTAMTVMKIGGALTVVALAIMIVWLFRKERPKVATANA